MDGHHEHHHTGHRYNLAGDCRFHLQQQRGTVPVVKGDADPKRMSARADNCVKGMGNRDAESSGLSDAAIHQYCLPRPSHLRTPLQPLLHADLPPSAGPPPPASASVQQQPHLPPLTMIAQLLPIL